jgi:hypothetical protein
MFFFKKKKLVVECFTKVEQLANIGIPRASKFLPEWWKQIPKVNYIPNNLGVAIPNATMKTCAGFIDLYHQGNILPMWSELLIDVDETSYCYQYSDTENFANPETHPKEQFVTDQYKFEHFHHMKLVAPWLLKCDKDVKFIAIEPTYNNIVNDYGIVYLPGVLDFKYNHGVNVNLLLPSYIRRIKMNFLDPLYHLICLDGDHNVEFKSILVDKIEYSKIHSAAGFRPHFISNNKKMKKCPFNV